MTPERLDRLRLLAEGKAPAANSGGVVVVLALDPADAKAFALKDGLPAKELHCTFVYYGSADKVTDDQVEVLKEVVRTWADGKAPIPAKVGGIGRFAGDEEEGDPIYLPVDAPRLTLERPSLVKASRAAGLRPKENHGYNAHITLSYVPADDDLPVQRIEPREITFKAVELWAKGKHFRFPLVSDYDTPEKHLRDAPKVEATTMHDHRFQALCALAASPYVAPRALAEEGEGAEHAGQKMVFGQWRKIATTPEEHTAEHAHHTEQAKAHEKAGMLHARAAGTAKHAHDTREQYGTQPALQAKEAHHEKLAQAHFGLSHAHHVVAAEHHRASRHPGIHVQAPATQTDALKNPEAVQKGRQLTSAHKLSALYAHRKGMDPAAADAHHPNPHAPVAPDPHESRRSRDTMLAEMFRLAEGRA